MRRPLLAIDHIIITVDQWMWQTQVFHQNTSRQQHLSCFTLRATLKTAKQSRQLKAPPTQALPVQYYFEYLFYGCVHITQVRVPIPLTPNERCVDWLLLQSTAVEGSTPDDCRQTKAAIDSSVAVAAIIAQALSPTRLVLNADDVFSKNALGG